VLTNTGRYLMGLHFLGEALFDEDRLSRQIMRVDANLIAPSRNNQ
jgi:hypothetical protein